ncbi:MAG: LysR family transcriptional regulator [Dialister invisus]
MDYRHLKYFMEVAEEKFQQSGEESSYSQSAISRMIKSLEDELGIILLSAMRRQSKLLRREASS